MVIKVAVVNHDADSLQSLKHQIDSTDDIACVVCSCNPVIAMNDLINFEVDIILIDLCHLHLHWIEDIRNVKRCFPCVQLLILTEIEQDEKIFEIIRAGASGYILKDAPPESIFTAFRELYDGGAPMSPSIAYKVITSFHSSPVSPMEAYQLTNREKEILCSLIDGLSYKKIANKFFISISTIRSHICHIYYKLQVHSKSQAVAKILKGPKTL